MGVIFSRTNANTPDQLLDQADQFRKKQLYQNEIDKYDQLIAQYPRYAEMADIYYNLGNAFSNLSKQEENENDAKQDQNKAIQNYNKAISIRIEFVYVHNLTLLYLNQKQYQKANDLFISVIQKLDEKNDNSTKIFEFIFEIITEWIDLRLIDQVAQFLKGSKNFVINDLDRLETLISKCIDLVDVPRQKDPQQSIVYIELLQCTQEKVEGLQKQQQTEYKVIILQKWGLIHLKNEQYAEAQEKFNKILQIDSQNTIVRILMGNLEFKQEKYENALQNYTYGYKNEFKKQDRDNTVVADCLYHMGIAHFKLKNNFQAIYFFKKCISMNNGRGDYYFRLGQVYEEGVTNYALAKAQYEIGSRLNQEKGQERLAGLQKKVEDLEQMSAEERLFRRGTYGDLEQMQTKEGQKYMMLGLLVEDGVSKESIERLSWKDEQFVNQHQQSFILSSQIRGSQILQKTEQRVGDDQKDRLVELHGQCVAMRAKSDEEGAAKVRDRMYKVVEEYYARH